MVNICGFFFFFFYRKPLIAFQMSVRYLLSAGALEACWEVYFRQQLAFAYVCARGNRYRPPNPPPLHDLGIHRHKWFPRVLRLVYLSGARASKLARRGTYSVALRLVLLLFFYIFIQPISTSISNACCAEANLYFRIFYHLNSHPYRYKL